MRLVLARLRYISQEAQEGPETSWSVLLAVVSEDLAGSLLGPFRASKDMIYSPCFDKTPEIEGRYY